MKRILHILAIALLANLTYAQELKIEFKGEKTIQEDYDANNEGTTVHKLAIRVERIGRENPNFDIPIEIQSKPVTASSSDYKIINPHVLISRDDFNSKGSVFEIDIYIEVSNDNEKADSQDEVFTLIINADLSNVTAPFLNDTSPKVYIGENVNITIIDVPKLESDFDPFRITVGANFDFEKTVAASFYFDAQAYIPNLRYFRDKTSGFGLGFYGSLYNNKYISQDSIQAYDQQFYEVVGSGDSIDLVRYNYQIGVRNSIKNIGAEFGLLWGWENKINTDVYVVNTFIFPEISAIHRRITSTYSYSRTNVDTLFNVPTPDSVRRLVERNFYNSIQDEVLLGAGYIGRFHSTKHGEFMFKFATGVAFQKSTHPQQMRTYYSFRFQLLDPKVRINLGGEVRGYYGRSTPYFGVYLSKSFGLKKLTEY